MRPSTIGPTDLDGFCALLAMPEMADCRICAICAIACGASWPSGLRPVDFGISICPGCGREASVVAVSAWNFDALPATVREIPVKEAKPAIKAIPTEYDGIAYRSRTEARWAVFFTAQKIPFCYEVEGFEFADGSRYLPDFWLPGGKVWFEVKPGDPDRAASEKASRLAVASRCMVVVAPGGPAADIGLHVFSPSGERRSGWHFGYAHQDGIGYISQDNCDSRMAFRIKETAAALGVYGYGPGSELDEAGRHHFPWRNQAPRDAVVIRGGGLIRRRKRKVRVVMPRGTEVVEEDDPMFYSGYGVVT